MTLATLLLFVLASAVAIITPGPTVLLALSNGSRHGVRAACWGMGGAVLADLVLIGAVACGLLFAGIVFFTGFGIFSMVGAILGVPFFNVFQRHTYALINLLFPVVIMFGRVFGFNRRRIERSFIEVSNQIIHHRHIKVPADRLLVVTPHCLQLATCPHKITRDPHNCKHCGGCDVGALVDLADEMGFHFFIVTGGTLARQTVKKIRPKAVLAIACERDLTSGIQDVYPLPAVGVLNIRPNGPCFNTHVDIEAVRKEIEKFLIDKKDD